MPARRATAAAKDHCIFCDLVKGSAEVSICYDDDVALAFMDVQPVNPGHVLVIPREHYETLQDIPRAVGWHLFQVATRLIPIVQKVAGAEDMNIIVNSGPAAGQNVFHYHIHLIPRTAGDGFDVPLPFPGSEMPHRHLLDAMAARIGIALREDPMRPSTGASAKALKASASSAKAKPAAAPKAAAKPAAKGGAGKKKR